MRNRSVIFGIGNNYRKVERQLKEEYEIVALVDNNWRNLPGVYSPQHILKLKYDFIIIMPSDYEDIYEQLLQMGIQETKIIIYACSIRNLDRRLRWLEKRYFELGLNYIGGRLDYRLTRLELLEYYCDKKHYEELDESQRTMLHDLQDNTLERFPRYFFPESYNFSGKTEIMDSSETYIEISQEDAMFYWLVNGYKIYLSNDRKSAEKIARGLNREFFMPNPHNYFDLEKGFTIDKVPDDIIVADVGAAEGLFGMLLIHRAKKIYLFENDAAWIDNLKKTYEPFREKVEIIEGTVGNGESEIQLDEFFKGKEKPSLIKMDVEGYEATVLKGMTEMLKSPDALILLICTYHRQDDYEQFYQLLHGNFDISSSNGYYWHMPDAMPPFFRHGVMRAIKRTPHLSNRR